MDESAGAPLVLLLCFFAGFGRRLLGLHDIILAVFVGRHADVFGELQVEIALRLIADHLGNPGDRIIGRDEQGLRFTNAAAEQVLHRRVPVHLFENMR